MEKEAELKQGEKVDDEVRTNETPRQPPPKKKPSKKTKKKKTD